jgi:hypothetical protein
MWYIVNMETKNMDIKNVVFSKIYEKTLVTSFFLDELNKISYEIITYNEQLISGKFTDQEVKILDGKLVSLRLKKLKIEAAMLNFQKIPGGNN